MKPAWYGGNKVPDSYLKKFWKSVEDEEIPYELRLFLDGIGEEQATKTLTCATPCVNKTEVS